MPALLLLGAPILTCTQTMAAPHRLPSLEALRYFECAARWGSITQAAHELCLTQSAVSQKILALEARLGYPLFQRLPRGLRLSEEGQRLYEGVAAAFDLLRDTLQTLRAEEVEGPLKVRVMPSFATKWLLPRMGAFASHYPGIQLLVDADMTQANFKGDEVDVAVSCEWTDNARLTQLHLFDDVSYPVASPGLVHALDLCEYTDLARALLLQDSMPHANYSTNWDAYFQRVGRHDFRAVAGPAFSRADLVLQAACAGQGVALVRHSLCADDLSAGRLLRPLPGIMTEGPLYLVCPQEFARRPRVAAFIAWMLEQARAHLCERESMLGAVIPLH